MKKLFSPDGLKILESFCFTPTLFAFDYDGTLARIVDDPQAAKMPAKTGELLRSLDKLVPVAIISGRSKQDLAALLPYKPKYLIGNHGLEGLRASANSLKKAQAVCEGWKKTLTKQLKGDPGVLIEDKAFSLAVHYRRSRSKSEVKRQILSVCGDLEPAPRLILGKCVVNVIPPGAPHKGMALLELMLEAKVRNAFYAGDDDTDEDIFALPDARILTVRVSRKQSSAAQFYIERQAQINDVLTKAIHFLRG